LKIVARAGFLANEKAKDENAEDEKKSNVVKFHAAHSQHKNAVLLSSVG